MTRRLVEGTKELCSLWGRAGHSTCPELPLGPNPGGSMPFAPGPASLPVIRIQARSWSSQLCKLPVSSWWETSCISLARGPVPCRAGPWGPPGSPFGGAGVVEPTSPAFCVSSYCLYLASAHASGPAQVLLLPRPFLMPQPSEHPLFLLPRSPSGSQGW